MVHHLLPRVLNRHTWLYRMVPSCRHEPYQELKDENPYIIADFDHNPSQVNIIPNRLRWNPFPILKDHNYDFIQGIRTILVQVMLVKNWFSYTYIYMYKIYG